LDIEATDRAERQIETFITRRENERRKSEGERAVEELWMPSERAYFARRQEDNRMAWCDYHRRLQALHQGLADEHRVEIEKLENGSSVGHRGEILS
jgi:predicted acetyltransferase